ncbi:hypothetical protein HPB47_026845 [Ixodes persulcatus]|uniref:Uncharacterized protein n=1 Tax=Ixodes persulcatus TaxID=34615 RepID=A0AC60PZZ3_IXOPE|nr:hypothetical protein HPB47_026845 [Ixodes persulcatus]
MTMEALIVMAAGLVSPWETSIGYLLTNGPSGQLLKILLEDAIAVVENGGLHVKAVVWDGFGVNVAMEKLLGCRVHETNYESLQPTFEHTTGPTKEVHFTFDACHALKLFQNLLGYKKVLKAAAYGSPIPPGSQEFERRGVRTPGCRNLRGQSWSVKLKGDLQRRGVCHVCQRYWDISRVGFGDSMTWNGVIRRKSRDNHFRRGTLKARSSLL